MPETALGMHLPEIPFPPPPPGSTAYIADARHQDLSGSRADSRYEVVSGTVVSATATTTLLRLKDGTEREVRSVDLFNDADSARRRLELVLEDRRTELHYERLADANRRYQASHDPFDVERARRERVHAAPADRRDVEMEREFDFGM